MASKNDRYRGLTDRNGDPITPRTPQHLLPDLKRPRGRPRIHPERDKRHRMDRDDGHYLLGSNGRDPRSVPHKKYMFNVIGFGSTEHAYIKDAADYFARLMVSQMAQDKKEFAQAIVRCVRLKSKRWDVPAMAEIIKVEAVVEHRMAPHINRVTMRAREIDFTIIFHMWRRTHEHHARWLSLKTMDAFADMGFVDSRRQGQK